MVVVQYGKGEVESRPLGSTGRTHRIWLLFGVMSGDAEQHECRRRDGKDK
jgi:hypothetical protein